MKPQRKRREDAAVTSEVFRAAVQEVLLLRSGFAFEREVNRSNLAMKLPGGVRRTLARIDADLLRPAISGRPVPDSPMPTPLDLAAWTAARGIEDPDPQAHEQPILAAALEEIARLRAICAVAADELTPVLGFHSLLKSRRSMVRGQITRLRAEVDGDPEAGYRTVPAGTLSACFDLHFPTPCLTPAGASTAALLEQAVCRLSATTMATCGTASTDLLADPEFCARCSRALGVSRADTATRQVLVPHPRRPHSR